MVITSIPGAGGSSRFIRCVTVSRPYISLPSARRAAGDADATRPTGIRRSPGSSDRSERTMRRRTFHSRSSTDRNAAGARRATCSWYICAPIGVSVAIVAMVNRECLEPTPMMLTSDLAPAADPLRLSVRRTPRVEECRETARHPPGLPARSRWSRGAGRLPGMPIAFDVRALASTVRIEFDDSLSTADQESIKAHWVDLAHDGDGEPDHVIRASVRKQPGSIDGAYVVRANSPEALAQRITSEITTGAINALRGEALMLHASAVALDDGRVVGFVGPSGRGKTTAAEVLGRAYGYVTDETLAVRVDGSVVAYPKPLSIGLWPQVKTTEPASTLGLRGAPEADLRLAAIV